MKHAMKNFLKRGGAHKNSFVGGALAGTAVSGMTAAQRAISVQSRRAKYAQSLEPTTSDPALQAIAKSAKELGSDSLTHGLIGAGVGTTVLLAKKYNDAKVKKRKAEDLKSTNDSYAKFHQSQINKTQSQKTARYNKQKHKRR